MENPAYKFVHVNFSNMPAYSIHYLGVSEESFLTKKTKWWLSYKTLECKLDRQLYC